MSNINQFLSEFSHFEKHGDGWFLLWSVDECESCEGDTEAPNSAKVLIEGDALDALKANGLTERKVSSTLGELGWSDDFGGAVCLGCYDKHTNE